MLDNGNLCIVENNKSWRYNNKYYYTEFDNVDLVSTSVNINKFSKYHTIFTE